MADIEFFFDPMCPWAWITSRLTVEVSELRGLDVEWRFISLSILNEEKFAEDEAAVAAGAEPSLPPAYKEMTRIGLGLMRIAAAIREQSGNDGVARFYTACGELIHKGGRSAKIWNGGDPGDVIGDALAAAEFPAELKAEADNETWDKILREETDLALSRTGKDVGTPIITFDTSRPEEASLFGPVINRIPRGQEALDLWDAVSFIARTPGIAEFKRSIRSNPVFD
ncbi:MAG TPA: hypothetical protein VL068_10040 [Microthrixaceae bacterium]|nr:hypothetical protein [Microthrixaceae bacterium]